MNKKRLTGFVIFLISLFALAPCAYPADAAAAPSSEQTRTSENTQEYKTGVYTVNGLQKYFLNGEFKSVTGIVSRVADKKQVYVEKGIFKKTTGIATRLSDKKKMYVQNGVFKKATGIAKLIGKNKYRYVKKGVLKKKFTGLAKHLTNKKWYFVYKGAPTNNVKRFYLSHSQEKQGLKRHYVEAYARAIAEKITSPSMSEKKKIRVCFNYVITHFASGPNPRIPHYTGKNWQYLYAYDMFGPKKTGNCMSYGAAFAFIAKAAGCKKVYAINNGGHGWTEINGLVYDPEQYHDTSRKIYAKSYNDPIVSGYRATVSGANGKRFRKWIKAF